MTWIVHTERKLKIGTNLEHNLILMKGIKWMHLNLNEFIEIVKINLAQRQASNALKLSHSTHFMARGIIGNLYL